jgi:hypothetical protein
MGRRRFTCSVVAQRSPAWHPILQSRVIQGMEPYLCLNHILFNDYLDHVKRVSQKVKQASVKPFENQGLPVQFGRDPGAR